MAKPASMVRNQSERSMESMSISFHICQFAAWAALVTPTIWSAPTSRAVMAVTLKEMTYYPVNRAVNRRSGSNRPRDREYKTDRYRIPMPVQIFAHRGDGRDERRTEDQRSAAHACWMRTHASFSTASDVA